MGTELTTNEKAMVVLDRLVEAGLLDVWEKYGKRRVYLNGAKCKLILGTIYATQNPKGNPVAPTDAYYDLDTHELKFVDPESVEMIADYYDKDIIRELASDKTKVYAHIIIAANPNTDAEILSIISNNTLETKDKKNDQLYKYYNFVLTTLNNTMDGFDCSAWIETKVPEENFRQYVTSCIMYLTVYHAHADATIANIYQTAINTGKLEGVLDAVKARLAEIA